ncbi:hypothetical protein E1265_12210 [Streptomyces sp. 8K308]|uniref:hypothetical protein n=1 Tax=Streptomyces sp. 8K308 TaxID=2530388 RepID=UPI001049E512|nr:hypothetical protein [Streptomyces sp. 8K308]TDC23617.1 hypothetical protein E1265_12210 [Streptomyces sp. 8K308]
MWWWFKARRGHAVLLPALAAFCAMLAALQDSVVSLPSLLTGSANPVLFVLMAPIPVCSALALSLDSRLDEAEQTSVRRPRLLDAALILGVLVLSLGAGWALDTVSGTATGLPAGRNTIFLTGLMLVLRAVVGSPAVMAPVAWIFAVILFGLSNSNHPAFWTVLPETWGDPVAALATACAITAGLAAYLGTRRPATGEKGRT